MKINSEVFVQAAASIGWTHSRFREQILRVVWAGILFQEKIGYPYGGIGHQSTNNLHCLPPCRL
jgi:hypothetical protein